MPNPLHHERLFHNFEKGRNKIFDEFRWLQCLVNYTCRKPQSIVFSIIRRNDHNKIL